ncbi:EscR/YscR/HrcR family type III secretion system export apparatus protein [Escherichia coli]|uniref:EscR/YscR/HrcR family type III secretion system export apparatus protein n=1 Tax=Escherichia coli TaxID=562 RepID=UPI00058A1ABF|nr:EscR/YscR/HrcR family type III secretion system export apparatus protein [Escherichia coli]EAC1404619.1 EscR/YscR/HrcR family type III secretion system export apparatus protein [Escherichia coli]EEW6031976.1 EscR/YscR/HrcR family type III secretion system export apparatus protein [Escherichia coli]EFC4873719.1 EscR/YscR/HrcR family type III secretion system export apparatus protein [Escherichia coli]EFN9261608.1 EscR/YscR/HrcR family type III secretion system export apparatus protein [Escher
MDSNIPLIILLTFSTLLPFLISAGTCFVKFSIVFVIVRNALGMQQVPSQLTLNGIALIMTIFVMAPVAQSVSDYFIENDVSLSNKESLNDFVDNGLGEYREYLKKYSDKELVDFFEKRQQISASTKDNSQIQSEEPAISSLLPAYALSEINSAFKIGFYIYLPFIVIDLVVSCVLLALGMMMMSPVTIATPIKLILFVSMDGWSILTKGLVEQYLEFATI